MKRGFTLMEVCVATVVLSIGILAVNPMLENFNHMRKREKDAVQNFICGVSAVEFLVDNPPACSDSLVRPSLSFQDYDCNVIPVHLRLVSKMNHLTVGSVSLDGTDYPINPEKQLRRILRCR